MNEFAYEQYLLEYINKTLSDEFYYNVSREIVEKDIRILICHGNLFPAKIGPILENFGYNPGDLIIIDNVVRGEIYLQLA